MNRNLVGLGVAIVVGLMFAAVGVYQADQIGRGATSQARWEELKTAGDELVSYQLYEQAIAYYDRYLENAKLSDAQRANLTYMIGNLYLEQLGDSAQALGRYLTARLLIDEGSIATDVERKIVEALERGGRSRDARVALQRATDASADIQAPPPLTEGPVIAKIGVRPIHWSEVEAELGYLPAGIRDEFVDDSTKRLEFVRRYVTTELLYEAAKRRGLDRAPAVVRGAFAVKKQLMVEQLYQAEVLAQVESLSGDVDLYYRAHKDDFLIPERVIIRHLVVTTEDEAEALLNELHEGADFVELATEHSLDERTRAQGGLLEPFVRDRIIPGVGQEPELNELAFSTSQGQVAGPVQTELGYHLLRVEEHVPQQVRPLEDVRPIVEAALRRDREREAFSALADRLGEAERVVIFDDVVRQVFATAPSTATEPSHAGDRTAP